MPLLVKAILPLIALSLAFAGPASAAKVQLSGQVTYRERVALPAGATLKIQLMDETLPNAPPRVAVEGPIGPGEIPLSFSLGFDDALILPQHSYALIASITAGGGLLFRNFEPYPVDPLAPSAPVEIVTNLVGQIQTGAASSAEPAVATKPAILDSTWLATAIAGVPVLPRTTVLLTIGDDLRAGGSGGCNSWFAPVVLDGDTIRLGSITSTRKSCSDVINGQEMAYNAALAAVATWQVVGDQLTLFGADGKVLLSFER